MERVPDRRGPGRRLTDRQATILEYVARGLENKEIGGLLGISEQAVKEHISALLRRLEVHNRAALADAAATLRLVGNVDVAPEWLAALFRHAPVLVALFDGPEHRFIAVNEAYSRASGGRELIGLSFRQAFPDLDEAGVVRLLDESFRSGEPRIGSEIQARWMRSAEDGFTTGYLTTLVQPVRRDDGTIAGTVFFGIDMTDAVLARDAARRVREEQQAILEQLPSGVVTVTPDMRIARLNSAGRSLLDLGDEVIGRLEWDALDLADPHTGEPIPVERRPLHRALRGERVDASDYHARVLTSGKRIDLRISAAPLFDDEGHVRGAAAVFTAIPIAR